MLLFSALPALAEKPKGGRLVVEGEYRVSLGEFPAEQSKTVAFKLKNVGDAAIGIASVSRACGCADAFMTTNVVDKGSSVGITFKTYPDKLPGTFVKTFYVITDSPDPRTKLVQLVVTGNGIVTKGKSATASDVVSTNAWASSNLFVQTSQPEPPLRLAGVGQLQQDLRLEVEFFVQEGCAECLVLRRDYLPALANRYAYRIRTTVSDTHSVSTFLRLLEKLEACGIKANEPVYMVVGGGKVLSGWGEIEKRGFNLIDAALSVVPKEAPLETGEARVKSLCGSPKSRPPACGSVLKWRAKLR